MNHVNIVQIMTYYSLGRWIVETQQMGENFLAGIADAYWYEWYVGLEKVLDLLNPDMGVEGVTLQASQQQSLDDVIVRHNDKKLECIQVKHTRACLKTHSLCTI